MEGLDTVVNTGLGMALAGWNDMRQTRQQRKLQSMQIEGQKEMSEYNRQQAMKMWHDTNYAAQRKELEKAGLNVGLMYGSAGAGGTTQGAGGGNVTGAMAPSGGGEVGMAIQLGLQRAMQEAQIENIKANTEKTKVDTTKTAGVDTTQAQTAIDKMKLEMKGTAFENSILQYEEQLKIIELNVADKNQHEIIQQMKTLSEKMNAELTKAAADGKIAKDSADSIIQLNKQNVTEQALRMAATKTGIQLTQEQINKIGTEIMNMEVGLTLQARKLRLEQIMTEYNIGGADKRNSETIKNYVNMLTDFISSINPKN